MANDPRRSAAKPARDPLDFACRIHRRAEELVAQDNGREEMNGYCKQQ